MKRYKFGIDHSPKKKFDIEDPDQRPISLINAYAANKSNPRSKSCCRTIKPKSNINASNRQTPVRPKAKFRFIKPTEEISMPESNLEIEDSILDFDTALTSPGVPKIPLDMISFLKVAKKYDTQPNSPIRKKYKTVDQRASNKSSHHINPNEFIQNYIYVKTSSENAKIIQTAFRHHEKKRRIQIAYDNQIRHSNNLLKACFINWLSIHENDPKKLRTIFKRFFQCYNSLPLLAYGTIQASFELFYKTEFLLIPNFLDLNQFYQIHFLLNRSSYRKVMRKWIFYTKQRIEYRTKHENIRYTIKKWGNYGQFYQFFQLWYRYSQWKKLERINHDINNRNIIQFNEVNVLWNLLERRLNRRRVKIVRAMNHSKSKIKLKAYHALHNMLIQKHAQNQICKDSDLFRSKILQKHAYKAWLKYIENKERNFLVLRESFRGWYSCIYLYAKKTLMFNLSTIQYTKNKMIKIFYAWYRISKLQKLDELHIMLNVQSHPAQSMLIIFLLLNEFDIFHLIFAFRLWIRVIRARKRWKTFCNWTSILDHDTELKQITLTGFRRIAKFKLIRSKYSSPSYFFPRETFLSFELTYREYINQKNEENLENKRKRWFYLTEPQQPVKIQINENKNELWIRCVLLYLNKLKRLNQIQTNEMIHYNNPFFQRCRSLDELKQNVINNTNIIRKRVVNKIKSYKILLNKMVTHISALQIQKTIPGFTIDQNFWMYNNHNQNDLNDCKDLIIFPDYKESIIEIKKKFEKFSCLSNFDLNEIKTKSYSEFKRKLRNPKEIFMKSDSNSELNMNLDLFKNQSTNTLSTQSAISFWSIENLCLILEVFGKFEQITESLLHFFRGATIFIPTILYNENIEVDGKTSPVISMKMPNSVCPNVKQTTRHKMINNIKLFLAQLAGYKDLKKIPRRVKTPSYVAAAVDAILTVHNAIVDTSLCQYCDETPFSSRIDFSDKLVLETYNRLWEAIEIKYQNVRLEIEKNEPKEIEIVSPFIETSSVVSFDSTKTELKNEDVQQNTGPIPLTSNDAILSCFLLPFIISFDIVKEFAKDELISKAEQ